MLIVAALFALLALALVAALILQQRAHRREVSALIAGYHEMIGKLAEKVTRPEAPMANGRPVPKVAQRSPERIRERALVGTVAPVRDGEGHDYGSQAAALMDSVPGDDEA